MGRFKDVLPGNQGWIHDLARAEVHPDAERLLQLGGSFDPRRLVEESTIDFLAELRERFSEHAQVFNAFAEGGTKFQDVKVYSIAQSAADFMMYRNQVKLVISSPSHGVVQLAFAQHQRGTLAVDGQHHQGAEADGLQGQVAAGAQDFLAHVGPFRDVSWTYQGEKVTAEQVARFYFVEFVRATRDVRRSRSGNQLLLDQIKALLQEKGLDL